MQYIVFDLEFNQPFNFKTGKKTYLNPKCPFEIIQIGAVKLNDDFSYAGRFNCLIKPSIYKRIHPFVEKITGFDINTFTDALLFPKACEKFIEFMGDKDDCLLCTWGIDDIKYLFRNMLFYKIDTELVSHNCINVQCYASKYLNCEAGKSIGLKNAVLQLELPDSGEFHNALNDADYTAEVFRIVCPKNMDYITLDISELKKVKGKRRYAKKEKTLDS